MTESARRKADACFALARSTTFEGERASAIARGTAIAEKAGLSLDLFDIPGRERKSAPKPPPSRYTDDLFKRSKAPEHYSADEIADVMRRFQEGMRSQAFAEAMREAADASRRAAEAIERQRRAAAERRERERASYTALADMVANALWAAGWRIYADAPAEDGSRLWHVTNPNGGTLDNVDDQRLCRLGLEGGAIDVIAEELRKRAEAAGSSYAPFHEYGTRRR